MFTIDSGRNRQFTKQIFVLRMIDITVLYTCSRQITGTPATRDL